MKILVSLFFLFLSVIAGAETRSYSWFSGETEEKVYLSTAWVGKLAADSRVIPVRVTSSQARTELGRGRVPRQYPNHTLIFTQRPQGGPRMALVGNFFVLLTPSLTAAQALNILEEQKWEVVEQVKIPGHAYILKSPPGLPSLERANHARKVEKVLAAEPIWWKEVTKK